MIVAKLAKESYCHSDDEFDPVTKQYVVKAKPARSETATAFLRQVDEDRKAVDQFNGRAANWRDERVRTVVGNAEPSQISMRLPQKVPLDWFAPPTFNAYPARLRAHFRGNGIALPDPRHWENNRVPDKFKTMDEDEWEPYAHEVRLQYNLPTEVEVAQMKANREYDSDDEQQLNDEEEGSDGGGDEEEAGSGGTEPMDQDLE